MESLKLYKPRIINRLRLILGVDRRIQRNVIEKNLDKINIDTFSESNIDYIINNYNKFIFLNSNKGPIKEPEKQISSTSEKIKIVIDFFKDLNQDLGQRVEKLYRDNKDKIYFDNVENNEIGQGFTSGNNNEVDIKCGDGQTRKLISRICVNRNNALDMYNIAHEFTHILINENMNNNKNPLKGEVPTVFIEFLIGEYMEKKGIVSKEEKETHNSIILDKVNKAHQIHDYRILRNFIMQNNRRFDRKTEKRYITEHCQNNKKKYQNIISNIAYALPRVGKVDSLDNNLRFINASAESYKLKQIYIANPDMLKKAFSQCLMNECNIDSKIVNQRINQLYMKRDNSKLCENIEYINADIDKNMIENDRDR